MKKVAISLRRLTAYVVTMCLLWVTAFASAAESSVNNHDFNMLDYLTNQDGQYTGPTVEENVARMDTDKNGFADVFEVRAFLAAMHGKDYQKELLDKWAASANGKSCSTPFATELYTDKAY